MERRESLVFQRLGTGGCGYVRRENEERKGLKPQGLQLAIVKEGTRWGISKAEEKGREGGGGGKPGNR